MNKPNNTPFSEYREEQVKVNIFDYFVEPSFFEKFCDTKPIIISGARGTGKTTILKALTMSESNDPKQYLENNNYIGVYYRIDLNVTASFQGQGLKEYEWEKLFSYYFVCKISYELINLVTNFKNDFLIQDEEMICQKYSLLFSGEQIINHFEDLRKIIFKELYKIRNFINNCAYENYPHIGDYAAIVRELPMDLLNGSTTCNNLNKTVFYLVDEFEGLFEWQQKLILSFVKYSDRFHTYKICMRPDGIKTAQTVGGEYVRETDDVRTVDLNELILEKREDYYNYALDVCKKRIELFYTKNQLDNKLQISFQDIFEEVNEEEEFDQIFKKKEAIIYEDISKFLQQVDIKDSNVMSFFQNNFFDFYIFRLMFYKNMKSKKFYDIYSSVKNKDTQYVSAVGNYRHALLYYLCLRFSIRKKYSGFNMLVNISGGTIRYLLELCNEIFERATLNEGFNYENPKKISCKTQTDAVLFVSSKRVSQISAIPQIGLNIRTFVISLGRIYRIFHRDDHIAKFETNHFSIKASSSNNDENIQLFLKECVMRGVLLKKKNNKQKINYLISSDEYMYGLHPIYTPSFQISWRNKQKTEFDIEEVNVLIGNDIKEINSLIKKYEKKYLKSEDFSEWGYYQMKLMIEEDE